MVPQAAEEQLYSMQLDGYRMNVGLTRRGWGTATGAMRGAHAMN